MTVKRFFAACGIFVMCTAGWACSSDSTKADTKAIFGTVVDAQTSAPLGGATATSGKFFMTTGPDGRFSLHALAPGAKVRIVKPGYEPIERTADDEFGVVKMQAAARDLGQ